MPKKVPVLVRVIAWYGLVGGIFGLFSLLALPILFMHPAASTSGAVALVGLYGAVNLFLALSSVVIFFGLRKMKWWALYYQTAWAIIGPIFAFLLIKFPEFFGQNPQLVSGGVNTAFSPFNLLGWAILIYLWIAYKKYYRVASQVSATSTVA